MENKYTKGLILGGLLIVAAAVAYGMSKEGRRLTKKIKDDFKPMAAHFKKNLGKLRDITKDDFDELVTNLVEEYAEKKDISNDSKKKIVNVLKSKWREIKNG